MSVLVTDHDALWDAMRAGGGVEIRLAPGNWSITPFNYGDFTIICGPDVRVTSFNLNQCHDVRIVDMIAEVGTDGLLINSCARIVLENLRQNGGATGPVGESTADRGLRVTGTTDCTILDPVAIGVFFPIKCDDCAGITVRGGIFVEHQADAIGLHGVEDVLIVDNVIYKPFGAFADLHADGIQLFSLNAKRPNRNIVIADNLIDTAGSQNAVQGIFAAHEEFETDNWNGAIEIRGNTVRTSMTWAIHVGGHRDVLIVDNDIIHDPEALYHRYAGDPAPYNHVPMIGVRDAADVRWGGNTGPRPLWEERSTTGPAPDRPSPADLAAPAGTIQETAGTLDIAIAPARLPPGWAPVLREITSNGT